MQLRASGPTSAHRHPDARYARPATVTLSRTARLVISASVLPGRPPRKPAGQGANAGKCTLSSAANVKPHTHPPQTLFRGPSVPGTSWPSVPARTLSVAVRAQPTVPHTAPWPRFPSGRYRNRRSPIGLTRAGLYLPRDPSPTGRIINDCVVRSFQEVGSEVNRQFAGKLRILDLLSIFTYFVRLSAQAACLGRNCPLTLLVPQIESASTTQSSMMRSLMSGSTDSPAALAGPGGPSVAPAAPTHCPAGQASRENTVSRVMNDEAHVKEEVRQRVLAAARELGYRRNDQARALTSGRTNRIGVVSLGSALFGPSSLLIAIERAARSTGFTLSVVRHIRRRRRRGRGRSRHAARRGR